MRATSSASESCDKSTMVASICHHFALFLPNPYSSLFVIRFQVQQANEQQSLTEGKCTRAQIHKNATTQYTAAKPAMCFPDSVLAYITNKLAPETKMKGYFLSNSQRSNHLIAMHPCNQWNPLVIILPTIYPNSVYCPNLICGSVPHTL